MQSIMMKHIVKKPEDNMPCQMKHIVMKHIVKKPEDNMCAITWKKCECPGPDLV